MANIFKTLVGTIASGNTSIVFTDENINNNSLIDVYFSNSEIDYNISQVNNSVTVEIEKQSSVTGVALFINNSDSVDYPITAENVSYGSSDVDTELNYIHLEFENINQDILAHATAINLLDTTKQDTLIPSDNITIENNVISSSSGFVYDNIKTSSVVLSFEDAQPHTYTPTVDEDLFINMYASNAQNRMVCRIGNLTILDIGGVSGIHPICIGVIHVKANTPIYLNGNYCFISKVV